MQELRIQALGLVLFRFYSGIFALYFCKVFKLCYNVTIYRLYIFSILRAVIFLHYRVATKLAIEILGYTMCRV